MSVENECNFAYRYRTVQKHLDGLGYKQTLPLDALPLVENLLADLIQTTESLKHFKSVAQDNIESCSQLQLSVNPYKCDNARLVQENNELHVELMREKEAHQKELYDLKKCLRRVEVEHGDLQLSSSRNLQRIKDLETESANKSKKILELQGKCCKPVVSNVSLASKKRTCYPLRRPLLECEILPKSKSSSTSLQTARQVEPYVVDFVAMADLRMNCLNYEVTKLKEELTLQTDNINTLEIQLALKEKEISRLRRMLEGGRPYNAVAKECSCNKFEKTHNSQDCHEIENCDLKILLKAKTDLEHQLKEALNKQHEAMSQALKLAERNEELEKELRDIDHIALSVEADCNTAVKENNRRVCRLQEKLNEVLTQVHALECELAEERRKVQELKTDLGASRLEKLDIQQTLEFTLEEKKNLTDRINQLTVIATRNEKSKEHIFNEEEEKLKSRNREISNDVQRILYEKESNIVSLQNKLINLEAERDYFREEYNKCRDQYSKESRNENATVERLQRERDVAKGDVERLVEERDALRERLKGTKRATINGLEDQLEDLREELKRTKQEFAEQRTQYFQLRALQDQTDQALGDVQGQLSQSETELAKAIDRNRNMEQQQIEFTNQVKDLKQEINNLHTSMAQIDHEKDQLLMVLDEKTEKIAALERELQSKEQQMLNAEQQLRDLQHKNQICVDQSADKERQVRSMQIDMDNLQRQITSSSMDRENAIQENMRLQDDLAAVTCELRTLQRELEASRAESFDLKKQLKTYVSEVRRVEELLMKKDTERTDMLNHFRSLSLEATVLENSNHSLESEVAEARDRLLDLDHQVSDKENLIKGYEAQIISLTQNVATLETELRQQEDRRLTAESDLNAVRDLCVKLDHQKDSILQQLGEKDSINSQFESQLTRLRTENTVVQDQISRDNAAIDRLEELLDQSRQESMNTQTANQELQNEISRLKQKNTELHNKLSSNSSDLKKYQNQAAEYSKQVSELRRQVTNERFDRARKEEETRSEEKCSSCCHCQSRRTSPLNSPNTPNTPREYNRTSRSRHFSSSGPWTQSQTRQSDWLKKPYPSGNQSSNPLTSQLLSDKKCKCSTIKSNSDAIIRLLPASLNSYPKLNSTQSYNSNTIINQASTSD
ncbi:centrosomal protein of 135 kDa-like isoform X2 [Leptopilina boulardi]|uniref:centrosomal protein of 135 kDa-like isoform X2 n=1 Tax=Leptopilina boulardi TaxID=63433 RepID=UPI0021F620B7|nr:centrosomal protein of 135 kDa-like isoform X2 [Leptopilina boulardi]